MSVDPSTVKVVDAPVENNTSNDSDFDMKEDDPDTCWIVDRRPGREDVRMRMEDWPTYAKREGL